MDKSERIKKTLNAYLETGLFWSLRIIIPIMVLSPFIPARYTRNLYWSGDMSYLQALLFYSTITVVAVLVIILNWRYKARRKSKLPIESKDLSIEIVKIEKRKYYNSTLFLLRDKEGTNYPYLNTSTSALDLEPGVIQLTVHPESKVIMEIGKN